ncbi:hypothetical protein CRI94_14675 [Longibacter salinarum]|uniref:Lipid/polyisoprenoid-binding YceI-like domain-containing protein n=1 Tax=Longibacter salinarum TaxID=1850348 RepID=A0A2A8CVJ8_9BACT|nr:YceI family protein [Longibacter salinarum]PEN12275.1 hypothetical protein CRI94_14675 [Longibacter salinarum]
MFRLRLHPLLILLLAATMTLGVSPQVTAQESIDQRTSFELLEESRFWIRGSTTVNSFTCEVEAVRGDGVVPRVSASSVPVSLDRTASLDVPVQKFDCGNDRMSSDLRETLNASDHPQITFRLDKVEAIESPAETATEWYRLQVLGALTISGTERLVRISAWGRPVNDDVYRVTGCKDLKMTYFGIEPPTKFMSLVKVKDRIVVHFDLLVETPREMSPALASHTLSNPPQCHNE